MDTRELAKGNLSNGISVVLLSYTGFTYSSPEFFSFLSTIKDNTGWQTGMFIAWVCMYIILPLLVFALVYSLFYPLGIKIKFRKHNYNIPQILVVLSVFTVIAMIVPMILITSKVEVAFEMKSKYQEQKLPNFEQIHSHLERSKLFYQIEEDLIKKINDPHLDTAYKKGQMSIDNTYKEFSAKEWEEIVISLNNLANVSKLTLAIDNISTKELFKNLFGSVQLLSVVMIIVFGISPLLYILFRFSKVEFENKVVIDRFLKILIGTYILMLVQMLQNVKVEHIDLDREDFVYTYANWYSPHFLVQSLGEMYSFREEHSIDNSESVLLENDSSATDTPIFIYQIGKDSSNQISIKEVNDKIESMIRELENIKVYSGQYYKRQFNANIEDDINN